MNHGATTYYGPARDWQPGLLARAKYALLRGRDWLDSRGRPAWILATIAAFVFVWPVGLALLVYMIGTNRMFSCANRRNDTAMRFGRSSGNTAFDAYRAETLKRLEDEHEEFMAFLTRLREARDRAEFEQFMSDRRVPAAEGDRREDRDTAERRDQN